MLKSIYCSGYEASNSFIKSICYDEYMAFKRLLDKVRVSFHFFCEEKKDNPELLGNLSAVSQEVFDVYIAEYRGLNILDMPLESFNELLKCYKELTEKFKEITELSLDTDYNEIDGEKDIDGELALGGFIVGGVLEMTKAGEKYLSELDLVVWEENY